MGVLIYSDEGRDCRYSREKIEQAASLASNVIVLQQGSAGGNIVIGSRGTRKYQLIVEDKPRDLRPGKKGYDALRWTNMKTEAMMQLSSQRDRLGVFITGMTMKHFPRMLPHRVQANLLVTYYKSSIANQAEDDIRDILGKKGPKWRLNLVSERPEMLARRENRAFYNEIHATAEKLDIPITHATSATPSAAGLVPRGTGVVCGLGPNVDSLHTPLEAVQRVSLFQRTILLAEILRKA